MVDGTDPLFLPISRVSSAIDAGTASPLALAQRALERIETIGPALNCFTTLTKASALREAEAAERRAAAKERRGPLDGIPVALKDNIDVAGVPTSNGFGGGPHRVPDEDAEVVRRLRDAGAIILGKLNMEEGAIGPASNNPHFGPVMNPYRSGYSPGGSSGGSGAAVAAGLCFAALGTDTGGSVRIPAAWCGVVGLKGSYGLVSTRGVVPLSFRLDHVGPLARTVGGAAMVLSVLRGFDARCPESRRGPTGPIHLPQAGRLEGIRLAVLRNYEQEPAEPAVDEAFRVALEQLRALGAEIRQLELPSYDLPRGRRAAFLRVEVEAAFVHGSLFEKEPHRFSATMRGYIEYGAKASAQQLLRADRLIDLAAFELARCFEEVDAIVSPTTPQAAFPFSAKVPDNAGTYTTIT
jgi:aspartyl-tRNA(Asn)/glutamyl-tRNA(Gln) amidotransferase subunit A